MKKVFLRFLAIVIGLFIGFSNISAQTDITLPDVVNKKGNPIVLKGICYQCTESYDKKEQLIKKTYPMAEVVYSESLDELKNKAKELLLKYYYTKYKEHNRAVQTTLINHADRFIKFNFEESITQTTWFEKRKGLPKYKFFIEDTYVNYDLMRCYAKAIDTYMSDNMVIIYHPGAAKENIDLYETTRRKLQAEYVNQEYKRTSVQNIETMPICDVSEKDSKKVDYYIELINCINSSPKINARIAVVVRKVRIIEKEVSDDGVYNTTLALHAQTFNTNTNSFVMDEIIKIVGKGSTEEASIENGVSAIIERNTMKYMHEEAEKYYNSLDDGKDFVVLIPASISEESSEELLDRLRSTEGIKVVNINNVGDDMEVKCKTFILRQADMVNVLKKLKPKSMGKMHIRAEYFEMTPKDNGNDNDNGENRNNGNN